MLLRIGFIVVTLFWLTMNVLLWRAEYGADKAGGSSVPVALVGEKILTAPDSSSLTILYEGSESDSAIGRRVWAKNYHSCGKRTTRRRPKEWFAGHRLPGAVGRQPGTAGL